MPEPVATIRVVPVDGGGFGLDVDSDLPEAMLASVLRSAADELTGRENRAAGCWGAA